MSDKAKKAGQDEETPKEPKERSSPKLAEPEGGAPTRPPRSEKPRSEVDRDSFRPPLEIKRNDKSTDKEEKKKRGKNG